jgi:hypothetical protein
MFESLPSDPDLLRKALEPLLEDFQYWFERSRTLLETERLSFLSPEEQQDFLDRILQAQQSVAVSKSLLLATDGQAGVEMAVLMQWHKLVAECWSLSLRHRRSS